jgi:hypothetical protein
MELHWCSCGKQTFDDNHMYCSLDCQNKEVNTKQPLSPPPSPPRFSVSIATKMIFANDLTAIINDDGFLSPQSSAASSYTESNPCSSVTSTADRYLSRDLYDDADCYCSTSAPIDIRQQPSADGESLEVNKGTFGEHKLHI